jgi:hypothetical protein
MAESGVEEADAVVSAALGSAQARQAAHLLAAGALGATRRKGGAGNTVTSYNALPETTDDQFRHLAEFCGPHSDMTPPLGWAIADNAPFAYC